MLINERSQFSVAWENSRHLATLPLVFPPWMTSEKRGQNFHTDRVTTQIWVVLLIGRIKFPTRHDQSKALPRWGYWRVISMEFLRSFLRRHLVGKPVVASPNVGCFLRLRSKVIDKVANFVTVSSIGGSRRSQPITAQQKFSRPIRIKHTAHVTWLTSQCPYLGIKITWPRPRGGSTYLA